MVRRWLLFVALLTPSIGFAQLPSETERLMTAGRIWVTVEYFHPYLAYRETDWDGALIKAIPKIRAATNNVEYQTALAAMLDELHDPETHLITDSKSLPETPSSKSAIRVMSTAQGRVTVSGLEGRDRALIEFSGATAVVRLTVDKPIESIPGGIMPVDAGTYPSTEARLFGAIKLWGAIHYFFAYKDLTDEDWDEVFPTYLPKFVQAKNAVEYNLVLADLLTHLTDTNAAAHSKVLDTYFGEAPVGLNIRLLDRYPIVSDVWDPAAKAAGVQPGDVVKRIDGISTTDIFRRLVQYVPASTPQRSGYDTIQKVTNGLAGSEVELSIENSKGEAHPLKLKRNSVKATPQRSGEAIRVLAGNIGYLDMERVGADSAEQAIARLKETKAIIFDLRSGKAPAAAAIAGHLVSQVNVGSALVTTPIALHPDIAGDGVATQTASTFAVRTVPDPRAPFYKGKTIALIDERTIGEAEYAGLLFEAANKTEFAGSPSAGADSETAELSLPGGITITYSTQDIRHANGGKLQRLGIQPTIAAPTTATGLRAGKDEALDAALSHLAH